MRNWRYTLASNGTITLVSEGHLGSISNKVITQESKVLCHQEVSLLELDLSVNKEILRCATCNNKKFCKLFFISSTIL